MTDTPEAVRLADPIKPLADAPIVAWCIESTDSADWCWSATRDGVIDNAKFLDDGCAPGEPFAVIRQADHQAQMNALLRRIPELETKNEELERLCDETYVKEGADAYHHACDEMERWQRDRFEDGKEVGTEGSLCDGIAWLYGHIAQLEAERDQLRAELEKVRVPEGWVLVPVEPTPEMVEAACQDGVSVEGRPVWKHSNAFQAKWKYQQMLTAAPTPPHADQKGQ